MPLSSSRENFRDGPKNARVRGYNSLSGVQNGTGDDHITKLRYYRKIVPFLTCGLRSNKEVIRVCGKFVSC